MSEKEKKVTQLQLAIGRLESLLSRLQQGAADAGVRTEAIIEARKRDVLAAVGEGDVEAKRRLHKLDGELRETQRQQEDYGIALGEAEKKLAAGRVELAAAERAVLGAQIEGAITERLKLGAQLESEILRNVIPQLEAIRKVTESLTVFGREFGLNGNFRQHSLGRALGFVISMIYREFPLQQTVLSGGELAWGLDPAVLNKPKPLTTVDGEYFGRTREQVRALLARDPVAITAE
jgi:hypothetical protein